MHSGSSELLLEQQQQVAAAQQQELRKRRLLELAKPKRPNKVRRTWQQRVCFYATTLLALIAMAAGSSLLFLVPLYVDPALSTLYADFVDEPVTCTTTRRQDLHGIFNCTWSSCREGCTSDMYKCTHIFVSYNVSENATDALGKPVTVADSTTDAAVLLVNIKGCGYPPEVQCGKFAQEHGSIGAQFPCYYSRQNRSVVMSHYRRTEQVAVILHYFAVPFVLCLVAAVILCVMHCDCRCDDGQRSRRRPLVRAAASRYAALPTHLSRRLHAPYLSCYLRFPSKRSDAKASKKFTLVIDSQA